MSFGVFIIQFLVPCIIVTICYGSISRYQSNRPILASDDAQQKRVLARRRRNNVMLIVVTVTHFLSWLPLNVANVVITTFDSDKTPLFANTEHLYITYAICHLASMTSAISNPILYGFMNENFRREFSNIWLNLTECKSFSTYGHTAEEIPLRTNGNWNSNVDQNKNSPVNV